MQQALREDDLITQFDEQTELTADVSKLRTQLMIETAKAVELEPAKTENWNLDSRRKTVFRAENSLGEPSIAAFLTLLAECDKPKNHCSALVL